MCCGNPVWPDELRVRVNFLQGGRQPKEKGIGWEEQKSGGGTWTRPPKNTGEN
jgi:hypothetical protein